MGKRASATGGVASRNGKLHLRFTYAGKQRWEPLGQPDTPRNRALAVKLLANIRRDIDGGIFDYAAYFPDSHNARTLPVAPVLFGFNADLWLDGKKGSLASRTLNEYRNALNVWKDVIGEDTDMRTIRPMEFKAKLGAHPFASAKLFNNYLIPLRGIFKAVCTQHPDVINASLLLENRKLQKKRPDPFSTKERDAILADIQKHYHKQIYTYFLFQFSAGTRPQEAIAARWEDLTEDTAEDWSLRIHQARGFRSELKATKTYAERDLELLSQAREALRQQRTYTFMKPHGFIFEDPDTGTPWLTERYLRTRYFAPTLRRLRIRWRKMYNTRHTYATALIMEGINPRWISRQLGHIDGTMLQTTYAYWIDKADNGRERRRADAALQEQRIGERE